MKKILIAITMIFNYASYGAPDRIDLTSVNTGGNFRMYGLGTSWASKAGAETIFDGVILTGLGVVELCRNQPKGVQQDGAELIAAGIATAGLGYMMCRLGERYEERHPYKTYQHWHSEHRKIYSNSQGFYRLKFK